MKIGVVSHIAGNPVALAAADRLSTEHGVEARICLGDVVGIYPFLEECIAFLVDKKYRTITSSVDDTFSRGGPYDFWSTRLLVSSGGIGSRYRGPDEPSVAVYDEHGHTLEVVRVDWEPESLLRRLGASRYPRAPLEFLRENEYRRLTRH